MFEETLPDRYRRLSGTRVELSVLLLATLLWVDNAPMGYNVFLHVKGLKRVSRLFFK